VLRNQYSEVRAKKNLLKLVKNEHITKLDKLLSVEYNILISISDLKRSFTNIEILDSYTTTKYYTVLNNLYIRYTTVSIIVFHTT
jgi:hypothetical protein